MTIRACFPLIVFLCGCSQYQPVSFNKLSCEGLTSEIVTTEVKRVVDPLYLESEWSITSTELKAVRLQVEAAMALVEKCGKADNFRVKPGASVEEIFLANELMAEWGVFSGRLRWLIFELQRSEDAPFIAFGRSLWKNYYFDSFKKQTSPSRETH